jgi:DNA polymerase-1
MSKTLIVDANSIGYACHYATKLTSGEFQTQAIFGAVKTARDLRQQYPNHKMIWLWDGRADWRYSLSPEYKSTRSNDAKKVEVRDAYAEQRPFIARALNNLGVRQMTVSTLEADDVAGYLVGELSKVPENEIVLISGDCDWIQLVRPNVTWRDLRDDSKIVTQANLMDRTGYPTPYAYLEGKCLMGDTSDCISGVGGIGEKGAPEFIAEFGSVRKFWQRCDSGEFKPTKKAHLNLCSANGRMLFGRNLRLMQLLKVAPPHRAMTSIDNGKFDKEKFGELCEELAFSSLLRNLDVFTNIFKEQ